MTKPANAAQMFTLRLALDDSPSPGLGLADAEEDPVGKGPGADVET